MTARRGSSDARTDAAILAPLRGAVEGRLPEALALLREWVGINSWTRNPRGVEQVASRVVPAFEALGFRAQRVAPPDPGLAAHLVLTRVGKSPRRIGLVAHLDTVYPPQEEAANDFVWREVGDRIYGPGTCDIKGGIALMWLMLAAMRDAGLQLLDAATWVVMLNAAEEELEPAFAALQREQLGHDALANLVLESGKGDESQALLVTSRKGGADVQITATGRSSHAGAAHELGANAVAQLAQVVTRLEAMTDYARGLTFNVGVIRGGSVRNRVPHEATAELDMRAWDAAVFDEALRAVKALEGMSTVKSGDGKSACRVSVDCKLVTRPWPTNEGTAKLLSIWQAAGRDLGMEVEGRARGGMSDGNHTWDAAPTLDGLGPVGANSHCPERGPNGDGQEYVLPASLVWRAQLNIAAISRLLEQAGV